MKRKNIKLARGMQCHFNFKVIKEPNFKVEMQCFKAILISLQNSVLVGNRLGQQISGKQLDLEIYSFQKTSLII